MLYLCYLSPSFCIALHDSYITFHKRLGLNMSVCVSAYSTRQPNPLYILHLFISEDTTITSTLSFLLQSMYHRQILSCSSIVSHVLGCGTKLCIGLDHFLYCIQEISLSSHLSPCSYSKHASFSAHTSYISSCVVRTQSGK